MGNEQSQDGSGHEQYYNSQYGPGDSDDNFNPHNPNQKLPRNRSPGGSIGGSGRQGGQSRNQSPGDRSGRYNDGSGRQHDRGRYDGSDLYSGSGRPNRDFARMGDRNDNNSYGGSQLNRNRLGSHEDPDYIRRHGGSGLGGMISEWHDTDGHRMIVRGPGDGNAVEEEGSSLMGNARFPDPRDRSASALVDDYASRRGKALSPSQDAPAGPARNRSLSAGRNSGAAGGGGESGASGRFGGHWAGADIMKDQIRNDVDGGIFAVNVINRPSALSSVLNADEVSLNQVLYSDGSPVRKNGSPKRRFQATDGSSLHNHLEGNTHSQSGPPRFDPYDGSSKKRSAFATSDDHDTGADLLDGPLAQGLGDLGDGANPNSGVNSPTNLDNQNQNMNNQPTDMSKFGRESMAVGGQGPEGNSLNRGFQRPGEAQNNAANNNTTWSPGAAKAALAAAGGVVPARTNSRGSDDSYVILPPDQRQKLEGNANEYSTSPEFFSAQPTPSMGNQMPQNQMQQNQFQQQNNQGQDFSGLFEESVGGASRSDRSRNASAAPSGPSSVQKQSGQQQGQQQQSGQQGQQPQQPKKSLTEQLEIQQQQKDKLLHQRPINPVQPQSTAMEDLGFQKRGEKAASPDASPKFDPWLDDIANPDNDEIYMLKFLEEMTKRKEGKERLAKLRAVEKEHDMEVRMMEERAAKLQAEQKELAQGNLDLMEENTKQLGNLQDLLKEKKKMLQDSNKRRDQEAETMDRDLLYLRREMDEARDQEEQEQAFNKELKQLQNVLQERATEYDNQAHVGEQEIAAEIANLEELTKLIADKRAAAGRKREQEALARQRAEEELRKQEARLAEEARERQKDERERLELEEMIEMERQRVENERRELERERELERSREIEREEIERVAAAARRERDRIVAAEKKERERVEAEEKERALAAAEAARKSAIMSKSSSPSSPKSSPGIQSGGIQSGPGGVNVNQSVEGAVNVNQPVSQMSLSPPKSSPGVQSVQSSASKPKKSRFKSSRAGTPGNPRISNVSSNNPIPGPQSAQNLSQNLSSATDSVSPEQMIPASSPEISPEITVTAAAENANIKSEAKNLSRENLAKKDVVDSKLGQPAAAQILPDTTTKATTKDSSQQPKFNPPREKPNKVNETVDVDDISLNTPSPPGSSRDDPSEKGGNGRNSDPNNNGQSLDSVSGTRMLALNEESLALIGSKTEKNRSDDHIRRAILDAQNAPAGDDVQSTPRGDSRDESKNSSGINLNKAMTQQRNNGVSKGSNGKTDGVSKENFFANGTGKPKNNVPATRKNGGWQPKTGHAIGLTSMLDKKIGQMGSKMEQKMKEAKEIQASVKTIGDAPGKPKLDNNARGRASSKASSNAGKGDASVSNKASPVEAVSLEEGGAGVASGAVFNAGGKKDSPVVQSQQKQPSPQEENQPQTAQKQPSPQQATQQPIQQAAPQTVPQQQQLQQHKKQPRADANAFVKLALPLPQVGESLLLPQQVFKDMSKPEWDQTTEFCIERGLDLLNDDHEYAIQHALGVLNNHVGDEGPANDAATAKMRENLGFQASKVVGMIAASLFQKKVVEDVSKRDVMLAKKIEDMNGLGAGGTARRMGMRNDVDVQEGAGSPDGSDSDQMDFSENQFRELLVPVTREQYMTSEESGPENTANLKRMNSSPAVHEIPPKDLVQSTVSRLEAEEYYYRGDLERFLNKECSPRKQSTLLRPFAKAFVDGLVSASRDLDDLEDEQRSFLEMLTHDDSELVIDADPLSGHIHVTQKSMRPVAEAYLMEQRHNAVQSAKDYQMFEQRHNQAMTRGNNANINNLVPVQAAPDGFFGQNPASGPGSANCPGSASYYGKRSPGLEAHDIGGGFSVGSRELPPEAETPLQERLENLDQMIKDGSVQLSGNMDYCVVTTTVNGAGKTPSPSDANVLNANAANVKANNTNSTFAGNANSSSANSSSQALASSSQSREQSGDESEQNGQNYVNGNGQTQRMQRIRISDVSMDASPQVAQVPQDPGLNASNISSQPHFPPVDGLALEEVANVASPASDYGVTPLSTEKVVFSPIRRVGEQDNHVTGNNHVSNSNSTAGPKLSSPPERSNLSPEKRIISTQQMVNGEQNGQSSVSDSVGTSSPGVIDLNAAATRVRSAKKDTTMAGVVRAVSASNHPNIDRVLQGRVVQGKATSINVNVPVNIVTRSFSGSSADNHNNHNSASGLSNSGFAHKQAASVPKSMINLPNLTSQQFQVESNVSSTNPSPRVISTKVLTETRGSPVMLQSGSKPRGSNPTIPNPTNPRLVPSSTTANLSLASAVKMNPITSKASPRLISQTIVQRAAANNMNITPSGKFTQTNTNNTTPLGHNIIQNGGIQRSITPLGSQRNLSANNRTPIGLGMPGMPGVPRTPQGLKLGGMSSMNNMNNGSVTPTQVQRSVTPTQVQRSVTPTQVHRAVTPTQVQRSITPQRNATSMAQLTGVSPRLSLSGVNTVTSQGQPRQLPTTPNSTLNLGSQSAAHQVQQQPGLVASASLKNISAPRNTAVAGYQPFVRK